MDLAEATARGGARTARHPWELARLAIVRRLVARHATMRPGSAVLDIGCGDLFVAGRLAAAHPGMTVCGIDPAFTAGLLARLLEGQPPNVRAYPSLEAIDPPPPRAALLLLLDVLEHVEDDGGFLRGLVRRPEVDAGTTFLLTVPAHQALFSAHDRALGHHRRYSRRGLLAVLAAAGLQAVASGSFFAGLLPLRAVAVLRERLLGAPPDRGMTGLVTWRGGTTLTRFLQQTLLVDAFLSMRLQQVGLRVPGLSLYAVCRRSA
jgi:2-polyprenyl-3-methyl-5-hydroxy-6-metoxy-1,4-benzoquinol methylase